MPTHYLRALTGKQRTQRANRHVAMFLAFVAGATNAGGFLAIHQYTSHMSGIVSAIADNLVVGDMTLVIVGVSAVLAFASGAATTAWLVHWARRRNLQSEYAFSLVLEAFLLLCFGLAGARLRTHQIADVSLTVMLLCFTMGLQNAIVTKISKAEIRTTHVTGMITDIGIELGKALYFNRSHPRVRADVDKLRLTSSLVGFFFIGGMMGALGFKHIGFKTTLPLAVLLIVLAFTPIKDDLMNARHLRLQKARSRDHSAVHVNELESARDVE